jgi:hypothetical protein
VHLTHLVHLTPQKNFIARAKKNAVHFLHFLHLTLVRAGLVQYLSSPLAIGFSREFIRPEAPLENLQAPLENLQAP